MQHRGNAARGKAAAHRTADLQDVDGPPPEVEGGAPGSYPGGGRSCLCLLAQDRVRDAAENILGIVEGLLISAIAASHHGRPEIVDVADSDAVQRILAGLLCGIGGAAWQTLQSGAQRCQVLIVRDGGSWVRKQRTGKARVPGIVGHFEEECEGDQGEIAQQIHVQQLGAAIRIGEHDTRTRLAWGNRVSESLPVEPFVYTIIGPAVEPRMQGPGDLQWRKVVRIAARAKQAQRL
ncbi:hypothetical protein D9M70_506010 [compost metagenome]